MPESTQQKEILFNIFLFNMNMQRPLSLALYIGASLVPCNVMEKSECMYAY